jgi:hypothetical protein
MALKMEFTTPQGFIVSKEDSYLKVTQVNGDKNNMLAILTCYNSLRKECCSYDCNFIPSLNTEESWAGDFFHQAYEQFKLMDIFSGAEDA